MLVVGYARNRLVGVAMEMVVRMQDEDGVRPESVMLAYALPTCVEPGRLRPAARCTLLQLVVALMSS